MWLGECRSVMAAEAEDAPMQVVDAEAEERLEEGPTDKLCFLCYSVSLVHSWL